MSRARALASIVIAVKFNLANGAPHRWLIPKDGFDEGIDLDRHPCPPYSSCWWVSAGLLRALRRKTQTTSISTPRSHVKEPDMTASTLFFLLLVLACPLMMMLMMRGGHGHGSGQSGHAGGCHGGDGDATESDETSTDELRRQRAELDRQIAEREAEERTPTPVGGWR